MRLRTKVDEKQAKSSSDYNYIDYDMKSLWFPVQLISSKTFIVLMIW